MTKIKGATAQKNKLKEKITNHAKFLGCRECDANWSTEGKLHSVLHFQGHLLHIIRDSQSKNRQMSKL